MKKLLLLLIALVLTVSVLVSCDQIGNIIGGSNGSQGDSNLNDNQNEEYRHSDFSAKEKAIISDFIGESIPFVPTNSYSFNKYFDDELGCECITFCTYDNTIAEFDNYRSLFSDYTLSDVYVDSDGDTWYCYEKGDICVEMSYYNYDGYIIDVYVYKTTSDDNSNDNNDNNEGENGENNGNGGNTGSKEHNYTDFTATEKETISTFLGELIPFVPNDEYSVDFDYDDYNEMYFINFYAFGNTQAEFDAYCKKFSAYTLVDSYEDDYGDTWYCYEKGDVYIEMSFYYYDGDYVIDLYAYNLSDEGGSGDSEDNGNENQGGNSGSYSYSEFTSSEKQTLISIFGEVIPFIPNNEYYLEEYSLDYGDSYEEGYNFYTTGNTQAEFNAYKALYSAYTFDGTDTDDYGDLWYYYSSDKGFYIDLSYYSDGTDYYVDVYVYFLYEGESGDDNGDQGGNQGGNTPSSGNAITNAGAGLPDGTNGVYNVDFTKGEYAKNVTDLGNYIDGCPTTGSPAVLVIPVDFSDINGRNNSYYSIDKIIRAFAGGEGSTDYYSVHDYYYISSYGQLDLDITVVEEWFVPQYSSSYYASAMYDYYGEEIEIGDQLILDEALAYLEGKMDLSKFDSDGNGIIDAVVMVNTLDIDEQTLFNWAYRYWNVYTDDDGYYYEYDSVSANDYMWMPYAFLYESYDANGKITYTDTSVLNTYTCIHEFGHVLGADDYYDTSYSENDLLLDGCDIMDAMFGDHNAYTKFNYGWIRSSRLVTTDTSVTLTLEAFGKSGDTIIIANNWDDRLGAYQEYYVILYYKNEGLNTGSGNDNYGYFSRDGIVVYHVNASLAPEEYDGVTYYYLNNNNTDASDYYGSEDNLIEFVKSAEGNFTYVEGDTMPVVKDDLGNTLCYNFTVDSINGDTATITFTKG